eukprot:Polyplicarium_translucidae@DN5254_c0_g1_i1.p1
MSEGKFFHIHDTATGLALDLDGGAAKANTKIVWQMKSSSRSQLFFMDYCTSSIRCCMDETLVVDASTKGVVLAPYNPSEYNQRFKKTADRIVHCENSQWCVCAAGEVKEKGVLKVADYTGAVGQTFEFTHSPPVLY